MSWDVASSERFADDRVEECCAGITALLQRASRLLPSFALLREAERPQPDDANWATRKKANDGS